MRQDYTGKMGPLWPDMWVKNPPEWPMYSYERPASILWDAIANELHERGWSDDKIGGWLRSKGPRWALDGDLGEIIRDIGTLYGRGIA